MSKTNPPKSVKKRDQDHDSFVRGFLSFPVLVVKLLRYSLDAVLIPYINFETLRPLSDTHIDKLLRKTQSDSIHECEFNLDTLPPEVRNLPQLPLFRFIFIWEHKSSRQTLPIDFQIGGYDDSIRRRDFKEDEPTLSVVLPILIYHGVEKWDKKRLYDYFKPFLPAELLAYIPHPNMIVIDIQAMSDLDIENAIGLEELRAAFLALKHGHDAEYFKQNMKEVLKFAKKTTAKALFEAYLELLYAYMQKRSKLDADAFEDIVKQLNDEEMVTEFKTIFDNARDKGVEIGASETTRIFIEKTILKTDMSDLDIALLFEVEEALVRAIRLDLEEKRKKQQ